MYPRFYRWAMDRLEKQGIIAFVTNRSFINSRTFDGFRKCLQDDFSHIYIIDTLSPNLDLNTFTLLESTHPIQVVNLGNGIFRFEFNQIWLPDSLTNEPASHGHFTYRIIESASNQFGSVIDNTAYIYFDWNDPIITNTTHHVNSQIENVHELTSPLQIHPNPATKHIELGLESPEVVLIKDINGKTVYQELVAPNQYIDIEHLKNGIYFIESKNKFGKLIKI